MLDKRCSKILHGSGVEISARQCSGLGEVRIKGEREEKVNPMSDVLALVVVVS
jgi:hypothetical protein